MIDLPYANLLAKYSSGLGDAEAKSPELHPRLLHGDRAQVLRSSATAFAGGLARSWISSEVAKT